MKKYLNIIVLFVAFIFIISSINVKAEDINNNVTNEEQQIVQEPVEVQEQEEQQEPAEVQEQTKVEEPVKADDLTPKDSSNKILTYEKDEEEETEDTNNLNRRVSVVINKLYEKGNQLIGAVLQILDADGFIIDEWTSNGTGYTLLLPDGTYILHEVSAPTGYKKAADKTFTVKVKLVDLDAGVDYSETPCPHYEGTPLYYVDFEGQKEEAYCINQDWETPDENSNYDGNILNPEDIKDYTKQTIYIDAQNNTEKRDISDQNLSSQQLYNKILDIIYHRQLASKKFSDLTEAEIRYITEAALKNYTNAGLTRVQGEKNINKLPEGYDKYDYYYKSPYHWYLYPHFRSFVYLPDAPLGSDIFTIVVGEGDAFGTIARHWNEGDHNAKNDPEVREKIARYYELYLYLISDTDAHPQNMYLYIFTTNDKSSHKSLNDLDDGTYQNLLGVKWANPTENTMEINFVNKKAEITPPITGINKNNNSNNSLLIFLVLVLALTLNISLKKRFN